MTPIAPCIDFEPTPLSDRLVTIRETRGYSQEEVSAHTGIGYLPLVRLELGEAPDLDQLDALAAIYGLTLDELVADSIANGFALAGVA